MEVAYLHQNWGLEYAKNVYDLWLACIIPVFYRSWTSCIEDRLQLVATAVVDWHGPVLTVLVQLPQHLANKKTSPVRLPSKFDEKTGLDQTFKLYVQTEHQQCLFLLPHTLELFKGRDCLPQSSLAIRREDLLQRVGIGDDIAKVVDLFPVSWLKWESRPGDTFNGHSRSAYCCDGTEKLVCRVDKQIDWLMEKIGTPKHTICCSPADVTMEWVGEWVKDITLSYKTWYWGDKQPCKSFRCIRWAQGHG